MHFFGAFFFFFLIISPPPRDLNANPAFLFLYFPQVYFLFAASTVKVH